MSNARRGDAPAATAAPAAVRVRRARPGDGPGIDAVRLAGWRHAYRGIVPDAYLDSLRPDPERREQQVRASSPQRPAFVAEEDGTGRIAGWLAAGPARDPDAPAGAAEVYACYVHPAHARQGIGRRLMAAALAAAGDDTPVVLWVLAGNRAGRLFYEDRGFRADGAEQALDPASPLLAAVREVRYLRPAGARP